MAILASGASVNATTLPLPPAAPLGVDACAFCSVMGRGCTTVSGQLSCSGGFYLARVGTMTVNFTSPTTGTLQYTVNGAQVTKTITRQTWATDNIAGNYLGGLTATGSSCSQFPNGPILIFGSLGVQQTGSQVSMNVQFTSNQNQASQCTFSGPFSQTGHLGSVSGNWNCIINGQASNAGTFTVSGIDSSVNGFTGHFNGKDQFCTYDGQFAGVRDVPLS